MYHPDPLGACLNDFYEGKKYAKIVVHSDIEEVTYLTGKHLFRNITQMPSLEKKALIMTKGKTLDVGGAAGCHSLILQEWNIDVHAIDVSKGAVDIMKKRDVKNVQHINFYDLKDEKYDTLLFLMNGIGIFGKLENAATFFSQLKKLMHTTSQVLFDSSDIIDIFEEEDGSILLDLSGGYYGKVEYQMEYDGQKGEPFDWLFIDPLTIENLANDNGFNFELIEQKDDGAYLGRLTLA